jgi:hypothetical protein
MANGKLDDNSRPAITAVSNADGDTPVRVYADPATHRLLVDSSGGSGSAGTEYTEDAAAASDPVGPMTMAVRADSLAAVTSTDGDNVALRATNKGELYVKQSDAVPVTDNGGTLSIDDGAGSITVDGSVTVTQGTGTNLHTVVDSGTISTITNVVHVDDNSSTLSVDDGAGSLTVDGTVTANAGTGTFAVSAASLPLPSGASTAAKQPALGTAGTASADVITVQGIASMTALKVDGSAVTQPVSMATNTPSGSVAHDGVGTSVNPMLMGGYASAAAPTDVSADGDATRVWLLRSGAQAVQPTFAGVIGVAGNGASGTGVQRVTIANDSTGNIASIGTSVTPGTAAANLGKAEDAAHSSGDTGVMMLGVREASPTDLSAGATDGDYEPLQVGKNGGLWVSQSAEAKGGMSVATGSIAATKTDIGTANTAGSVYGWYFYNPNSSVAYVQFFNTQASGVTLGTTAPVYSLGIPATSGANVMCPLPIAHSTAICIAVTTTRAGSTGTGSTVDYNIFYKQ